MGSGNKNTARPMLACEISSDRVIAARTSPGRDSIEIHTSRALPPGMMKPSLTEKNVGDPGVLSAVLADALGALSGRSRDVIAVLPDPAVRVVLLDFDSLPEEREEAIGVIRFRLRKSLPFDVDKAKVSYQAQSVNGTVRVVAAVALNSVIEEYESVIREAGFNPGIVLPSMLAALLGAPADRGTLVVKVDARTTSIALLDQQQLLLFRTLENARGVTISGEQLAEDVYPSVVFFQDTYNTNIEQIFVSGISDISSVASSLQSQTGAEVKELVKASQLGLGGGSIPKWRMASVIGALLSTH